MVKKERDAFMIFPVNGTPDRQPQAVAVDVGHGYVKGLNQHGQRVMFPSLICLAPTGPDLGKFGHSSGIKVNDSPYLIGDAARLSASSLFSREKATDPLTLALTWAATAQVVGAGYYHVSLGVGLPLSWYASQKDALAAALKGTVHVDASYLMIESVSVFPQGIGALLTANLPASGLVGLIDIGYRTVDYLIAEVQHGAPVPLLDRAGTWSGGIHIAYQAMAAAIEKQTDVHFEAHELADRDAVTVRGQPIDLTPYRAAAFKALAGDLTRHLAASWDGIGDKLDVVLLAGGGALALEPYLEFPGQYILLDSQWANAQGYLNLL